jgi:hypothetical protein
LSRYNSRFNSKHFIIHISIFLSSNPPER